MLLWLLLAWGVQLLWWQWSGGAVWGPVLGAVFSLLAAGLAWAQARRLPVGDLVWDGGLWQLNRQPDGSEDSAAALTVVLDLQWALLLRWPAASGRSAVVWLWVQRAWAPERWHGLRCAVYSRAALGPLDRPPLS
ncbi:hypothetical protein PSQ20_10160 [Curvibacter sp. RS43]|uniref:hypothetical protein n=1 Tax=Curvibacter microcysteis TaxID=3026419 RepID=UPI00235E2293|nr:hypothetical protein [Curvibacter sp. RS43]MDD0810700.1 hypothetical protein [Curvibacter sp. RS43]